jgi:hypothetical protein
MDGTLNPTFPRAGLGPTSCWPTNSNSVVRNQSAYERTRPRLVQCLLATAADMLTRERNSIRAFVAGTCGQLESCKNPSEATSLAFPSSLESV